MGYYPFGKSNIEIGENDAEVGYWMGKPHWNKGYCTEALQAMIRYCYEQKNFKTPSFSTAKMAISAVCLATPLLASATTSVSSPKRVTAPISNAS